MCSLPPLPSITNSTPTTVTTALSPDAHLSGAYRKHEDGQNGNSSMLPLLSRRGMPNPTIYGGAYEPISPLSQDRIIFTLSSPVNYTLPEPTFQSFQLRHLELFYHFEHDMWRVLSLDDVLGKRFMAMVTRRAIEVPYLMDQLLAFSALHMYTYRPPHEASFYREEATRLQTRALGLFNAAMATVTTNDGLPAFLFSILLSHHILFDTLSTRTDFPAFLDKLVACFHLCAGVRTIAGKSWNSIITQYYQQMGIGLSNKWMLDTGPETIFTKRLTHLRSLIEDTTNDTSVFTPCTEALDLLRNISSVGDAFNPGPFRNIVVLRWAVVVPPDFVKLIEQRRPEALVITAYYGILIHNARDFWVFGDAGAFIIRSITRFLGSYWAEWLAWPNELLDMTGCASEVQLHP
ncbi:hypothetical protein GQX73_g7618 [Xylaria multiplex]|uniref:Uncharacterized protein n=1 Tax=Xylaria multiplex TaxID=323545 RepID=A0A7C8MP26_9PEZI|nr:hypothetical protein GQX73_g7618 [Xylaria multiplex]